MTKQNYEIIPSDSLPISSSGINKVLNNIRPVWRGKNLIQRVERLLPVDPSSACQRLFNAAIHDLKEKLIIIGVDLVKEVAQINRLPSVNRDEDILEYNVSKTIDLAYNIGLLSRPEWRRIHRCYEIRRDLEHEDNEYEAVLEDCFYIFKTTIDVVLSKDPIELLKVKDAKELVESPGHINVSEEFLNDYKGAPKRRQKEINELLISYAYSDDKPDIVRENSVELMRQIKPITDNTVTIELAQILEGKIGRNNIDIKTAKIGHACGAVSYFKKVKLKDFYSSFIPEMKAVSGDWHGQGAVCKKIEDIGGLIYCPNEIYEDFLKELLRFYLGEPSYGPFRHSRPVFFSNSAAPIIARIVKQDGARAALYLNALRGKKSIKNILESSTAISKRFENLLDLAEAYESE